MQRYLVLLRGINVGGKNILRMADLRQCFEDMGFYDVRTYIQSGNILFGSDRSTQTITTTIEKGLAKYFAYKTPIFLVTQQQVKDAVSGAPNEFGKEPQQYRYDVVFLRSHVPAQDIVEQIETREGVDTAIAGNGVIYFSRLIAKATRSYLPKIIHLPAYKDMTIRNWNTTNKLLKLMEDTR